ncbi:hypothetical protein GLOIN_2v1482460 [Rhizophagus clarus]|uniref:Uncharacterized protein n=1 Tax=Rhizophagus clarus TaxID=94130 RepID=A0A8H3LM39_9GLOM|nr:hypothetical protein GLOIN_2v1482460 [Rhizophagus clarus]
MMHNIFALDLMRLSRHLGNILTGGFKIENRDTKSRRAVGVVRTKVKDYNSDNKKKSRHQTITESSQSTQSIQLTQSTSDSQPNTTKSLSQKRHQTIEKEMKILSVLKVYKDKLLDDTIISVCK